MVKKVLVAGASGALGLEVVKKLREKNVPVRALDNNKANLELLKKHTEDVVIADAGNPENMTKAFDGISAVFSSIGQSVSLFSKGGSFEKTDYEVNESLINSAVENKVERFVYISIKGIEKAPNLQMANVHMRVEDLLKKSGINFTAIRPVGIFSGFNDWLIMGKKGVIPVPGSGENKTNPIHQEDLAQVVVDNMFEGPEIMEAGGPQIYTRNEIAKMIKKKTNGRIVHVPVLMIIPSLLFLRYIDDNIQAKLDYFKFVSTNDMVAPGHGHISFRDYIENLDLNDLPDVW
jgi:uncharacterized protein YbjT (DUF2867 family)